MSIVRIIDLPSGVPNSTHEMAFDLGETQKATIADIGDAARPFASQAEAEGGVDNTKTMTPLTSAQQLAALGPTLFATTSEGALAATALQPADVAALAFKDKAGIEDIDATGSPTSTTFLAGNGSWTFLPGGGNMLSSVYDPDSVGEEVAFKALSLQTADLPTTDVMPLGAIYQRFLSTKLGDVLLADDFQVTKESASDQSSPMNSMINAAEDRIGSSYNSDLVQTPLSIDLGPGTIRLDAPLRDIPYGVRFVGRGSPHTKFACYGAFTAISMQEFESDGTTRRYYNGMRFSDFYVLSMDPSNRTTAFKLRNMIRNCAVERVGHLGCEVGFDVDWSWTLHFRDCAGAGGSTGQPITSLTDHHFYLGSNNGAITLDGGRFDVAEKEGFYAVGSDALELFLDGDVAFQSGKMAGVKVLSARTVRVKRAFLEGNCIGTPGEFHMDLRGSGSSLSSCYVEDTVMNNLNDANRDGSGILYVDGFEDFYYKERWTRNNVQPIPIVGPNGVKVIEWIDSAATIDPAVHLQHLTGPNAASASAIIYRTARPTLHYGKPVSNGNLSQTGTDTFGALGQGFVMLGGQNGVGILQAHDGANVAEDLNLQPAGGLVYIPGQTKRITSTSSNYTPTNVFAVVAIDTSGGGRSVNFNLSTFTIPTGYVLEILKTSATGNLTINPPAGTDTINGVAGAKVVTAAGRYTMTKQNATAWLLTYEALA